MGSVRLLILSSYHVSLPGALRCATRRQWALRHAAPVPEFWTLIADLERHYSEPPLAFEADLVRILRLCDSRPEARPLLVECCRDILNGTRTAPQELVPFLMWRLR